MSKDQIEIPMWMQNRRHVWSHSQKFWCDSFHGQPSLSCSQSSKRSTRDWTTCRRCQTASPLRLQDADHRIRLLSKLWLTNTWKSRIGSTGCHHIFQRSMSLQGLCTGRQEDRRSMPRNEQQKVWPDERSDRIMSDINFNILFLNRGSRCAKTDQTDYYQNDSNCFKDPTCLFCNGLFH